MPEKIVQVGLSGSGDAKVYHTQADCSALKNIVDPQDVPAESLTDEWRECGYCSGEHDQPQRDEKRVARNRSRRPRTDAHRRAA